MIDILIKLFVAISERIFLRWYERAKDRQQGSLEQRTADLQAALAVSKEQAQAAADAPKTRAELEDTLKKGEL